MSGATQALLEPLRLGRLELANRIVMAPMTRSRAQPDGELTEIMTEYYRQRAGAGLIISEGLYPSEVGKGYCRTPGLVTGTQTEAWRSVTDAVHGRGGLIMAQIMHVGRVAHPDNKAEGAETVAPSSIRADTRMWIDTGGGDLAPTVEPRALETDEIPEVVAEYARATEHAYEAGFDGVQLHGTSGYLPAQFLSTGTNRRDDAYGGSAEGRCRFVLEVLDAMCGVDGADRVSLRICPANPYNDLHDEDPVATFGHLLDRVDPMGLAFLEVIRLHGPDSADELGVTHTVGSEPAGVPDNPALARDHFSGPLVLNDSYDAAEAAEVVTQGAAAAISFGRPYINNPDLAERTAAGIDWTPFENKALYLSGPDGYIDFGTA